MNQENNYAFIDSQNLNLAIRDQGWVLDFYKFRRYLLEKYSIKKAFLFIGYLEENKNFYNYLRQTGYICFFKPTLRYKDGTVKGNCDAELVLQTMIEYNHYHKAIIISGDGDFYCLVDYLNKKEKLLKLLVPNGEKYSKLLKRLPRTNRDYMNNLQNKLEYKKSR